MQAAGQFALLTDCALLLTQAVAPIVESLETRAAEGEERQKEVLALLESYKYVPFTSTIVSQYKH